MICDYEEIEFLDEIKNRMKKIYRPTLRVNLIKRGFKLFPVKCLLDSGADMIIFPAELADLFEVGYKKFSKVISGIAGGGITNLYQVPFDTHQIHIFIDDMDVKEKIYFSKGQQMPLLGQDFFKHFKIIFERNKKRFSLEQV